MKIKDIKIEQIKNRKNWKVVNPDEFFSQELEDLTIDGEAGLSINDYVVYSSVFLSSDGKVTPLVIIKEISSLVPSGDMCEFIDNKWKKVGLNPDPTSTNFKKAYIGNPLSIDPSFDTGDDSDDEWEYNRNEFSKLADKF